MPIRIPPARAGDDDKARTVRATPRSKTAFTFMADSPVQTTSNRSTYFSIRFVEEIGSR
jgi:hypothetical protein